MASLSPAFGPRYRSDLKTLDRVLLHIPPGMKTAERLGTPVSDRHRPPEAGECTAAARRDGATPPASAIRPWDSTSSRPFGPRAGQRPAF